VENLSVGHTLESWIDLSGALEDGTDSPQCLFKVLVERRALQFPEGR
jgi:hypothetical protein